MLDRPRTVRCAQCAHDWMAEAIDEPELTEEASDTQVEAAKPDIPDETELPDIEPEALVVRAPVPGPEATFGDTPLSAIERLSEPGDPSPRLHRRDRLLTAAWAASCATLTALVVAGYIEREPLMRQWPASKRVYATLGLASVNGPGGGRGGNAQAGDGQAGDGQSGDAKGGPGQSGTGQNGAVAPARQ
jgi:hypothetical protein